MPYMTRQFNTRFVERPLTERPIEPLCQAVQDNNSRREFTISDNGVAMLAALVGKKIPQSLLPVIAACLQDILDGNGGDDSGHGGLLTEVYGEILGPLMTCLERQGDFEIIRLLKPRDGQLPDILIVDKGSHHVILQECKATCCTIGHASNKLDVCRTIKDYKNDGAKQLNWPDANALRASNGRVRISPASGDLARLLACSERSVVVTAIPDGEIQKLGRTIEAPERIACSNSCAENCLYQPGPHIITGLFSEKCDDPSASETLWEFIGSYGATEKAAWGGAHGCFSDLYSNMIASFSSLSREREMVPDGTSLTSFLTGPIEYAIQHQLYVDIRRIASACSEYLSGPLQQSVFNTVHTLASIQGDVQRPASRESSTREFHTMIMGAERQSERSPVGNWTFHSRNPEANSQSNGTMIEAQVRQSSDGYLDVTLVPARLSSDNVADDIQWALAETVGGEYASDVSGAFVDEIVHYRCREEGPPREFRLGRVLNTPCWPWPASQDQLDHMHDCCPFCDHLAHWMENHWLEPFRSWHRFWRHHQRHHVPHWGNGGLVAFVTTDGRGRLRIPNWNEHR